MAVPNLTALSPAQFPQAEDAVNYEVRRVSRIFREVYEQVFLRSCDWSDEWCNCKDQATVHDLKSEQEFCARHFHLLEYRRD